ncbi:MAG: hypothetical protein H0V73_07720 [Chloroflexi bacterium]|nr:hypothetical protein [Chloroflexota bacterium]
MTPNRANGASDGLSSTNGPANRDDPTTASAIAAIDHMTGLPVQIFSSDVGLAAHSASSGQTTGRGRRAMIAQPVMASGTTHQANAVSVRGRAPSSAANGTNSHSPTGGYSTSPARISYGPASWYGSKNGPPCSHRLVASR